MASPLVVTEVRRARAGRDDEGVIADRAAVRQPDLAPVGIEGDGLAEEDGRVLPPTKHGSERLGDLAGTKGARRDLVEKRLEEVEVAAVDDGHVDPAVRAQIAGRVYPAESTADDQGPMLADGRRARHSSSLPAAST